MDNIQECKKIILYLLKKGVALQNGYWYHLENESPLKKIDKTKEQLAEIYNDHLLLFSNDYNEISKILDDPNKDIVVNVRLAKNGTTPLMNLLSKKDTISTNVLQKLLEKGADPSLTNASGENALFIAANYEQYGRLRRLFEEIEKIVKAKLNPNLEEQKNKAITHINKIDDKNTETILHIAFRNENLYTNSELVKKLIMPGDYLNQVCYGETPLEMFLLKLKTKIAENAYNEIADKLIKAMTVDQLNFTNIDQKTILCQAVIKNDKIIVELIIARAKDGVDINKNFPIGEAVQENNEAIYKLLDAAGASKSTSTGETIFHKIYSISDEFLNLLVNDRNAEALINSKDKYLNDTTPLQLAIKNNHQSKVIAKLLEIKGINLNEQDNNSKTALHYACQKIETHNDTFHKIATLLLEKGADKNIKDKNTNQTPFESIKNSITTKASLIQELEKIIPEPPKTPTKTTGTGTTGAKTESPQVSTKLDDLKNALGDLKEKLKSLSKKLSKLNLTLATPDSTGLGDPTTW